MKKLINTKKIIVGLAFLYLIFMMSNNLMYSALWGDEWVEYNISRMSILNGEMYEKIIETFQPPLYNLLMHFWLIVNESFVWFRSFNVVIGFITAIFIYKILDNLYDYKVSCVAICVFASCYQWIYCIQECSEYALMLCCLSGSLYFYVKLYNDYKSEYLIEFIIFCVLSIYSQYGAIFVALPLIISIFIKYFVLSKDIKQKKDIVYLYILSFLIFAVPLYCFFINTQINHNEIVKYTSSLKLQNILDFPFVLGRIIGYLFNLYDGKEVCIVFSIISILLLMLSIYLLCKNINPIKKELIICLLFAYFLHYMLVSLQVYAMAHANESSGFYVRYSYFYIPILCICIPILLVEMLNRIRYKKIVTILLIVFLTIVSFFGYKTIRTNWHKSLDNVYADIWMENYGWENTTFLFGMARFGFYHYILDHQDYHEGYLSNYTEYVDYDDLPEKFWCWRTNWGGEGWLETINIARKKGYNVIVYDDSGEAGQLAFCYK